MEANRVYAAVTGGDLRSTKLEDKSNNAVTEYQYKVPT